MIFNATIQPMLPVSPITKGKEEDSLITYKVIFLFFILLYLLILNIFIVRALLKRRELNRKRAKKQSEENGRTKS